MKDIDNMLADAIKVPKHIGDKVYVFNGNDELISVYDALDLGMDFFLMSNDAFFTFYGFNYVPKGVWMDRARRKVGLV